MPSLSLSQQIRISIIALVTVLVAVQSVATLRVTAEANFQDALEGAQSVASQVMTLLVDRLNLEAARANPPPTTLEESTKIWTTFLENDPAVTALLEKLMTSSKVAMEIEVYDGMGRILASSIATRPRVTFRSLPDFSEWQLRALWDKLFEILTMQEEYGTEVPLGLPGQDRPVFTIRVITSSVLMRNALMPQVRNLVLIAGLSLLAAILMAVVVSNSVLKVLDRLGRRIDLITSGKFAPEEGAPARESREVAAVSSKLNLLSEQFRDAKADAMQLRGNIDQLFRNLETAVMLFDPDHRLVLVGRQSEHFLALRREEMMGLPMQGLFPESTAIGAAIAKAVSDKEPFHDRPMVLERSDRQAMRILVSVELLENYPGLQRPGTLVTLRDVESRRQLQSQLDVSSRLTAINRLTGGVAHEIKNPLNAIALHLEVLRAKLSEPSEVAPEMEVIEREITRLDRVVKTFLDFTRPVRLALKRVDLVALVGEVTTLVAPEAKRGQVEVAYRPLPGPAPIRADRDLLSQAILNVVVNGIESMPAGGTLSVAVEPRDGEVTVTVTDHGSGIPEKIRDKVFNLYFTTKESGSGIGLAMTFRVVHLHDASIDFRSEVGKGTTFELRFPAADGMADLQDSPEEAAAAAQTSPAAQPMRKT